MVAWGERIKNVKRVGTWLARPEWLDDAFGLNKERYKISLACSGDIL
jgi:hypothetical protein